MTVHADPASSVLDRIRRTLVGLRMPRALEMIEVTVHQLERGEVTPLEAIETLLAEELSLRESRRIKTALVMARLSTIKTLAGFDFAFQPSLDRRSRSQRSSSRSVLASFRSVVSKPSVNQP
jgi:DNA replication protein DnaC